MKVSIKHEVWLSVDELKFLQTYYDGDYDYRPSDLKDLEERLVQGILDQFLREWDLEGLCKEITKHKLHKMLEVNERKIFDLD